MGRYCSKGFQNTHTLTLSLVRDGRKTVSSLKVRRMESAKEELLDALSLTRERV